MSHASSKHAEGSVEEEITIRALDKVRVQVVNRTGHISVVVNNDSGHPIVGLVTVYGTPDGHVREVAVSLCAAVPR